MLDSFLTTIPLSTLKYVKSMNLTVNSDNCNRAIDQLLGKSVLLGGKRLRPLLTYLLGTLFNVPLKNLEPYAKAIELVHAASLSHDDVIDNATLRRGKPSINIQGSNKKAVLAGDYLLANVIVELCDAGNFQLVREMSLIIEELADGEWLQNDLCESRQYSRDLIETIAKKKTSSVMSWCCFAPAYLSGHNEEIIEVSRLMGINLGMAFQLMDDTLDFSGDSQKDAFLDLENGVVNAVIYEWLVLNPEIKKSFEKGELLSDLFTENHLNEAVQIVRDRALRALNEAKLCLSKLESIIVKTESDQKKFDKNKKPILFIFDYLARRKY